MIPDPHAPLLERIMHRVLRGPGESPDALRVAAAGEPGPLPEDLVGLVEKIHAQAYRVTDAEVARAQARYGDDQLFELIVSASLGASQKRLAAGLAALEQA